VLLKRSSAAWAFVAGDILYAHPGGDLRLGGVTATPSMTHLYVWGNMRVGEFIVRVFGGGGAARSARARSPPAARSLGSMRNPRCGAAPSRGAAALPE